MTTFLTPFDLATATQSGRRLFRKQILRKGTINYKGQKVTFDDAFIKDCVKAFKAGAYDQVPFVFADPDNRHNMDPERFRGEIKGLEMTADGLDAIVEATPDGAKVIRRNPRLGVSARIVQGLDKGDGRTFPRAIQHVLATMDPRLTGMRPWETVDLSEDEDDEDEVIDLTAASIKEGTRVGTKTATKAAAGSTRITLDLANLTDEQFELLLAATAESDADTADTAEEDDDETVEEVTSKQTVKRKGFKKADVEDEVDDEADDEDDEDLEDDEDDDEDEADEEPVAKKTRKREKVSLSTPVKRTKISKSRRLELELAEDRWERQKGDYLRAGVPPVLLDLAGPILAQPDKLIIDLSETGEQNVDAKVILRKVLDEVTGMIDLAPEMGHGISLTPDEKSPTGAALKQWSAEYGDA